QPPPSLRHPAVGLNLTWGRGGSVPAFPLDKVAVAVYDMRGVVGRAHAVRAVPLVPGRGTDVGHACGTAGEGTPSRRGDSPSKSAGRRGERLGSPGGSGLPGFCSLPRLRQSFSEATCQG